jgi:hypothetical protein
MLRLSFSLLLFLAPLDAAAFILHTTSLGENVRWYHEEITVVLDESLEKLGPRDEVEDAILESFDLWMRETEVPFTVVFEQGRCDPFAHTNQSCITACDEGARCSPQGGDKGAATHIHFLPASGRITGASIVLNARDWQWTTGDDRLDIPNGSEPRDEESCQATLTCSLELTEPQKETLDLGRVMTHEIGHFLGIDHSDDPEAVMYFAMTPGDPEVLSLHDDDIHAVNALYSDEEEAPVRAPENHSGGLTTAGLSYMGSLVSIVVLGLTLWMSRRARRRGRRAT